MMPLAEVLNAIGPKASIGFAVRIVLGVLRQRCGSAIDRDHATVRDIPDLAEGTGHRAGSGGAPR